MQSDEQVEIARFYTRSRRFPKVIGRLHDGSRIPGGPYTVTQAVVGGAVLVVALVSRGQWGTGSFLFDFPLAVGVAWGGAWGAGRIPATRRNLVTVVLGGLGAMLRPVDGKYRDAAFKLRQPHRAGGSVAIEAVRRSDPVDVAIVAVPLAVPSAAATDAPRPKAVTGVERLLQQSQTK
jgi:hypothetical protein